MIQKFLHLCAATVILMAISIAAFAKDVPASAEQLRSELSSAIKGKDTNAIVALFNLNGVSDDMKSIAEMVAAGLAQDGAASVKLSPLPADAELTNEVGGIRYFPNVAVLGMMDVESPRPGNMTQIPYGESGGKFYFSGVLKEVFNAGAPQAKMLSIMFVGLFPQKPEIITGNYAYLNGGKEISKVVRFTNSMSYNFRGDGVRSCQFNSDSREGSIKLIIAEDGKKIFDSGMIERTNVIRYDKK